MDTKVGTLVNVKARLINKETSAHPLSIRHLAAIAKNCFCIEISIVVTEVLQIAIKKSLTPEHPCGIV